jgi:S-formylglutathione hydrolase FrmB
MALIHLDHVPETVKVNIPLNIILPDPGQMGQIPVSQRKILYLLHGLSDDASAWQRYSMVEVMARQYGLVVIMPSVGRSFYIDQPNGQNYFTYLVDELPKYLFNVFGIVPTRDNTLIAGISMGGYGAFKAALLRPQNFFAAASFSGVLSLAVLGAIPDDPRQLEFSHLFGDLNLLQGSGHDPAVWLSNAARSKGNLPKLYISCGRQDDLYPLNVMTHKYCQAIGLEVDYHEEDGKHDWNFWNPQLQRFLSLVLDPIEQERGFE